MQQEKRQTNNTQRLQYNTIWDLHVGLSNTIFILSRMCITLYPNFSCFALRLSIEDSIRMRHHFLYRSLSMLALERKKNVFSTSCDFPSKIPTWKGTLRPSVLSPTNRPPSPRAATPSCQQSPSSPPQLILVLRGPPPRQLYASTRPSRRNCRRWAVFIMQW